MSMYMHMSMYMCMYMRTCTCTCTCTQVVRAAAGREGTAKGGGVLAGANCGAASRGSVAGAADEHSLRLEVREMFSCRETRNLSWEPFRNVWIETLPPPFKPEVASELDVKYVPKTYLQARAEDSIDPAAAKPAFFHAQELETFVVKRGFDAGVAHVPAPRDVQVHEHGAAVGDGDQARVGEVRAVVERERFELAAVLRDGEHRRVEERPRGERLHEQPSL